MMRNQKEKPALSKYEVFSKKKLSNLMIWRVFLKLLYLKICEEICLQEHLTPNIKHTCTIFNFFFATAIEWQVDKSFTFHVKSLGGNLEHYIFSIDFLTNYIVVGSELPNRDHP